jgi:hypothetical protein
MSSFLPFLVLNVWARAHASRSVSLVTISDTPTQTVDSPAMRSIDLLAVPRRWGIIIFSDEVAPTAVHL